MLDTQAERCGLTFVTTELGGGGTATARTVAIAARGARNLLIHAGVLEGEPEPAPSRRLTMPGRALLPLRRAGRARRAAGRPRGGGRRGPPSPRGCGPPTARAWRRARSRRDAAACCSAATSLGWSRRATAWRSSANSSESPASSIGGEPSARRQPVRDHGGRCRSVSQLITCPSPPGSHPVRQAVAERGCRTAPRAAVRRGENGQRGGRSRSQDKSDISGRTGRGRAARMAAPGIAGQLAEACLICYRIWPRHGGASCPAPCRSATSRTS